MVAAGCFGGVRCQRTVLDPTCISRHASMYGPEFVCVGTAVPAHLHLSININSPVHLILTCRAYAPVLLPQPFVQPKSSGQPVSHSFMRLRTWNPKVCLISSHAGCRRVRRLWRRTSCVISLDQSAAGLGSSRICMARSQLSYALVLHLFTPFNCCTQTCVCPWLGGRFRCARGSTCTSDAGHARQASSLWPLFTRYLAAA